MVERVVLRQHTQVMYNLTVATAHTFFVGEGQWLVHNDCFDFGKSLPNGAAIEALNEALRRREFSSRLVPCRSCAVLARFLLLIGH